MVICLPFSSQKSVFINNVRLFNKPQQIDNDKLPNLKEKFKQVLSSTFKVISNDLEIKKLSTKIRVWLKVEIMHF